MTGIEFHYGAPDKLAYTCRMLRKAAAKGAKVVVTAEPEFLRDLDTALWTFSALEFVPHCAAGAPEAVLRATPIVLAASPGAAAHHQVLVNLGASVPDAFERFERLIEVVSLDEEDRLRARSRWKHYKGRGYELKRVDLELKETA
jgi:DNA polymerase-3 subunit chi